ncbi:hypothetical protein FRC01_008604 [Tulasnella sp. 417]|nr:hypothetical protein FRC01_008604 [Tulasnella sp. 417]
MVVQTEEAEEEENQAVDSRKTRRPPSVRDAATTPTLPPKPRAILRPRLPPASWLLRGGFKSSQSSDVQSFVSGLGYTTPASSKTKVKSKVLGAMNKYLHSCTSRKSTAQWPQVKDDSENEIKFPSRLGHERMRSTNPATPEQPYLPSSTSTAAYASRISPHDIRVFPNSAPSTSPPTWSEPLKYARLSA